MDDPDARHRRRQDVPVVEFAAYDLGASEGRVEAAARPQQQADGLATRQHELGQPTAEKAAGAGDQCAGPVNRHAGVARDAASCEAKEEKIGLREMADP
jgi:hypothetical protein